FRGLRTSFDEAEFRGEWTWFGGAFHSEQTSFRRAQFIEGCSVDFSNPAAWHNVQFDWDDHRSSKPANVLPDDWPPQIVPTIA
ncbi:hypothetical protein GORHZ_152_00120, partial [Gordonia rhizosphera NBRC 16068]